MREAMRVQPQNLIGVWSAAKRDILAAHPEIWEARAGELAAARVFNWFKEDWAELRDEVRNAFLAGGLGRDDERLQVFRRLIYWTPLRELERLSGSRTVIRDLDNPIVAEGSTPPADIIAVNNYWRTERIPNVDEVEDASQVWKDIRAEFRGRAGSREGAILTNHQGALAIRTAFEILDLKRYGEFAGITSNLSDAEQTVDFFRHEAEVWPDDPGKNFDKLADIFEEAIIDALAHGKNAVAIVDTTSAGYEGPTLSFAKQLRRHEAFHVWENTINPEDGETLAESVIMADPDYVVPKTALAEYYPEITPNQIVSEAMAFISSGDWEAAGFPEKTQALEYLDRYFISVVEEYGIEALDGLRLVHPDTKEVIDHVRAKNDIGRAQESPGGGSGAGGQTDGRTPPGRRKLRASQSRLVGGRLEENGGGLRRNSQESGELKSSGRRIDLSQPGAEIGFYPAADISRAERSGGKSTSLPGAALAQNTTLAKQSSEWRREFWAGHEIEPGARLTSEEFRMIYGPEGAEAPEEIGERLRIEVGSALAQAEGIANYGSPRIAVERFDASAPRIPFIEEALVAGASVDQISIQHHGSDWTVVSFENAQGTYLLKGEEVYVTQAGAQEAQSSIEADPVALPGISDLRLAGDIEIATPDVSFSQVIDSMGPNNRAILERALEGGAVVNRFWGEWNGGNSDHCAMAVVSFENAPGAYIFWNGEDIAQSSQLDLGAARYALELGYEIGALKPVSEIRTEEKMVEPRGRAPEHALSM